MEIRDGLRKDVASLGLSLDNGSTSGGNVM